MKISGLPESFDLCNHSNVKWSEEASTFGMVDYVREKTAKKHCKYGEYGSFQHLLFLLDM